MRTNFRMRTNFNCEDTYITMTRGDTVSFGLEATDQDGNGIEFDTGYLTCKKMAESDDYIFQKSIDDGITYADDGQYVIRIAPEDTADIDAGKYYYDLQFGVDSDVFTVMKGILEIEQDSTF